MGRKNKRIARSVQAKLNTKILSSKPEIDVDLWSLEPSQQRIEVAHICNTVISCPELHVSDYSDPQGGTVAGTV